jgi:DNA-directed RNA polymerase specialized sigma24 family protein
LPSISQTDAVTSSDAEFDRVVRSNATKVRHYALRLVRDPWLADDDIETISFYFKTVATT